ncbi:MAG: hypothetical protein SNJ76_05870, partial [Fimbriimonadaceae bacterium]
FVLEIFKHGLLHDGMARRQSVFGLANMGDKALPALIRAVREGGPLQVPAAQAIYWMRSPRAATARRELLDVSPDVRLVLSAPRPWDRQHRVRKRKRTARVPGPSPRRREEPVGDLDDAGAQTVRV